LTVQSAAAYRIVRLANGTHSIMSLAHHETFHPVVGPVAEAEKLYLHQLRLAERMDACAGEFVIWDVGLGAAANVLTVLRGTRASRCPLRILSFDHTLDPLRFALTHASTLGYFDGYEDVLNQLINDLHVSFLDGARQVTWDLVPGDFPTLLADAQSPRRAPQLSHAPHAVLFDAFSPKKNPAMWTQPLFANLFRLLNPARPCALPTYSRSTMLRVSLLLAGFYVGAGHATGEKEETSIAANTLELIEDPLNTSWLERVRASSSAEPLWEPTYRQAPLCDETWQLLQKCPQFHPAP
jgi:tRNA U34 5-methylaminomethyl-2-thiouridine-forming methyltransferase MnmC